MLLPVECCSLASGCQLTSPLHLAPPACRFVQRLRYAAASLPNVTVREGFVRRLVNSSGENWEEDKNQPVCGVAYKVRIQ